MIVHVLGDLVGRVCLVYVVDDVLVWGGNVAELLAKLGGGVGVTGSNGLT